ncbi:hypothetical protein COO60DRAFT_1556006, partial [Scenedesmus sp. NREL 46B-D3]
MSARSALRLLLRAVDRNVTSVAGNQQWRQHILQQFRANAGLQDAAQQQQMLLLAQEYADLINNVAHHQELLLGYNLGVDPDARNKEMVAKTAARVGFQLPQLGQQQQAAANEQQQEQVQPQQAASQFITNVIICSSGSRQQQQQQQPAVQRQACVSAGRHQKERASDAGVRQAVAAAAYIGLEDSPFPSQLGSRKAAAGCMAQ